MRNRPLTQLALVSLASLLLAVGCAPPVSIGISSTRANSSSSSSRSAALNLMPPSRFGNVTNTSLEAKSSR
ncbi:MAG: hypothetical protein IPQ09_15825 [Myxococcales bacterium]|nr:hypothetical protein [Myxococcales bacterium]HQY59971.1 hypothetical protein [Polyangiaceae bacterium]